MLVGLTENGAESIGPPFHLLAFYLGNVGPPLFGRAFSAHLYSSVKCLQVLKRGVIVTLFALS